MMIDRVSLIECIQCQNCKNVCPVQAISMSKLEGMFIYPKIDDKKCIHCQKCEKVCPALSSLKQQKVIASYAVKNRNKEICLESSSGGLFSALAETIIEKNGYVFGAAFRGNFKVEHIGIDEKEKLFQLRGSKYVQSNLKDTFVRIEKLLEEGNLILFSGTPCQCAALNVFMKSKKYSGTLYIIDFICHGILSEKLFADYIEYLEKKEKSEIESFEFRNKTYGWLDSGPKIKYKNGRSKNWPLYEDLYMQGYFQGLCMRESCYQCNYKNMYSGSDITMGDFWGADVLDKEFYDEKGVSLCCVQNERGMSLLNQAQKYLDIKQVPVEVLIKYNQGLLYSFKKGEKSESFFEEVRKTGNIAALKKITKVSWKEKIKRVYRKIRRNLKNR